ncbi:LOW QUALITY PROTEIN: hypothetical protein TorRG33x02_240910 [Trema orientale]|uniref:Retrovirus-related Pol polyprotein from transposon TNT 1-94 n=1 Tax=Trema orientale TaxID=63057 RepID=A0A2P5DV40_TREOI|nr:LOW QUALITY PROTEIN: hypothetical protein TorRG33x02_240910 [Trema orientale]
MGSLKFELSLFDGPREFGSWRKKMKALLVQHKLQKVLDSATLPATMSDTRKAELQDSAYSIIVLYLADNVLKQIDGEDTAYKAWNKLGELYLTKSFTNRILLKEKFFRFKMDPTKNLEQNPDDFRKIAITLGSIDKEKIGEESQAIILLNSLPNSYREVKAAIKFGKQTITLDEVTSALRSWELEMKSDVKCTSNRDRLNVRGRSKEKNPRGKS